MNNLSLCMAPSSLYTNTGEYDSINCCWYTLKKSFKYYKIYHFNLLSVQFSDIKYIDNIVQALPSSISRTFSSSPTKAL